VLVWHGARAVKRVLALNLPVSQTTAYPFRCPALIGHGSGMKPKRNVPRLLPVDQYLDTSFFHHRQRKSMYHSPTSNRFGLVDAPIASRIFYPQLTNFRLCTFMISQLEKVFPICLTLKN
jgi:hypothetical protein